MADSTAAVENGAQDFQTFVWEPTPEEYVYNTPDAYEKDPEILRAELLFFNNPQSQRFASQGYYALKDVQEQCQMDYEKLCSANNPTSYIETQAIMQDIFVSSLPYLMSRKLSAAPSEAVEELHTGRGLLKYLRSFYVPTSSAVPDSVSRQTMEKPEPLALTKENLSKIQEAHKAQRPLTTGRSHVMRGGVKGKLVDALKTSTGRRSLRASMANRAMSSVAEDSNVLQVDSRAMIEPGNLALYDPVPLVDPIPLTGNTGVVPPHMRDRSAPALDDRDRDHDRDHDRKRDRDQGRDHPKDPPGPPRPPRKDDPHGPPPPPHHPPHHRGDDTDSDSGSDSDSEEGSDGWDPHHDRRHGPPGGPEDPRLEDTYFPGALGFGASGDLCLYENVQSLSQPCMQSVADLYQLRENYWNDYTETQQPHHDGGFIFVFACLFFLGVLVKKIMIAPRRKHMRMFLQSLNGNPELKAQVERELGVSVPVTKEPCCGGARNSFVVRLLKAVGIIAASLFVSFFISITSLEMTAAAVDSLEQSSNEPVSPFAVIAILFSIVSVEILFLLAAVRGLRYMYSTYHERPAIFDTAPPADGGNGGTPLVSYPHSYAQPVSGNSNTNNGGNLAYLPISWYQEYVSPRLTSLSQYWQRRTNPAATEGYSVLQGQEEQEMIQVGSVRRPAATSQDHYAVYTGVPVRPHSLVATTSPMVARPVSAVHFV